MQDDPGASEDERSIELSSIEAIYPELELDPTDPFTATLNIPVTPERPLKIYFQASADSVPAKLPIPPASTEQVGSKEIQPEIGAAAAKIDIHELAHLPPLTVKITLPEGYPTALPPKVELLTSTRWIPKSILKVLKEDCTRLWEEIGKDQVVYIYIDHIQQAAEQAFGVGNESTQRFELPGDLKLALLDYDLKSRKEQFEKETFDCGICLEPKKGVNCHRLLLCGDVFCVACLQDFYNNCITEGDVDNVKCLSVTCSRDDKSQSPKSRRRKHDRTLNPSELLQIPLSQETVQRYVKLKRKKKLESDKNTVYCPRQWCQGAARSEHHPKPIDPFNDFAESESEPENLPPKKKQTDPEDTPMSDRLCVCEDCNFAFCSVCKKGWHGELARCNPRRQAELNEEEKASLAYMQRFSTPCPTCNAPSQKTYGCNHMICFKCKTHFCYLCSSYLMPDNPYRHFNDFKSPCYMRLWELEAGDGMDAGHPGNAAPRQPEDFDVESDSDEEENLPNPEIPALDGIAEIEIVDDSDDADDEPAPDQRRPERRMHIEIVNFARNGANQRIQLPDRPRAAGPVPPAPMPPRRRGGGQQGNHQRRAQQEPNRRALPNGRPQQPARIPDPVVEIQPRVLPVAAPGQGQNNQLPGPMRAIGLERFLELAMQDQEDEWDSDELDEDDEPLPAVPRNEGRRADRVRR